MGKEVILTGLRANNDLHVGNYLGAMLPIVDMATQSSNDYQVNVFVPDLHSFTTPIDHAKLQTQIMQNLRLYVAAGLPLDNQDVHIYRQSYIPAHSELTWILDCFTGMGEMGRMTQFKDKTGAIKLSNEIVAEIKNLKLPTEVYNRLFALIKNTIYTESHGTRNVSVGLFNYPVLMAADILLYGATYVPVGDDQTQHLEFTRDIAERMNKQFGDLFIVPKPVKEQHSFFGKDQGLRIKDLLDPKKKMSKSDETGKGVIFLNDNPEAARKKIMAATTDSMGRIAYNHAEQPGLGNLMDLLALLSGQSIGKVCNQFVGQEQYGVLKNAVADAVAGFLADFQSKLANVSDQAILKKLEASEQSMREQSGRTLLKVQKAVGLRPNS